MSDLPLSAIYSRKAFPGREYITGSGDGNDDAGLIISGTVFLESVNPDGYRRILDCYTAGDYFWKKGLSASSSSDNFVLIARTKCDILFLHTTDTEDIRKILPRYEPEDVLTAAQQRLLAHIHILSQHSHHEKILAFLEYHRTRAGENPFRLPMSLTDAADYLAIDRSAMMRQIGLLEKEGLFSHHGRTFHILQD